MTSPHPLLQRFHLPLPQGLAWLEVPCAAPGDGLAQARALGAALPALVAAEHWLGLGLPCPQPGAAGVEGGHELCLRFDDLSPLATGRLAFPWAALQPARTVPAQLALQWPGVQARVRLQTLPQQHINAPAVVPGAVLLLPAAFAPAWSVEIEALGIDGHRPLPAWRAAATLVHEESRLRLHGAAAGGAQAGAAGPGDWSVWLRRLWTVDLRAWFGDGSCAPGATAQAQPATAAAAADQAELHCGPRCVATGRLLPCGAGWGLRIEAVDALVIESPWDSARESAQDRAQDRAQDLAQDRAWDSSRDSAWT